MLAHGIQSIDFTETLSIRWIWWPKEVPKWMAPSKAHSYKGGGNTWSTTNRVWQNGEWEKNGGCENKPIILCTQQDLASVWRKNARARVKSPTADWLRTFLVQLVHEFPVVPAQGKCQNSIICSTRNWHRPGWPKLSRVSIFKIILVQRCYDGLTASSPAWWPDCATAPTKTRKTPKVQTFVPSPDKFFYWHIQNYEPIEVNKIILVNNYAHRRNVWRTASEIPQILNLGTKRRWMLRYTLRPL
jgi:hypothetical protein